jgi:hypothetical protein
MLNFIDDYGERVDVVPDVFTIAGYTGRDRAAVQKHIDELVHEGIAPPAEVPILFSMPVEILTTGARIHVPSASTSGEVEPVLIGTGDALYLGVGSDHTARDVEREDIARSKRICPKPVGRTLVQLQTLGSALDDIGLESSIDGEPYQHGTFAAIMPLGDLFERFRARTNASRFVLFCGTVPLLRGAFRYGRRFTARLHGGPLRMPLTLDYDIAGA